MCSRQAPEWKSQPARTMPSSSPPPNDLTRRQQSGIPQGRTMKSILKDGISRRQVLQAGLATAASAIAGPAASAQDQSTHPPDVRVIDIHAHYFPETYLALVAADGKRFDAAYYTTDKGWFIKTPAGNNGPLPNKFIDLKARIADMDQQGVALQAISLTA